MLGTSSRERSDIKAAYRKGSGDAGQQDTQYESALSAKRENQT